MTGGIDGGGGELEPIPLTFSSAERYVAVLEPLLHEEARAGVQVRGSCEGKGVSVGGEGQLCRCETCGIWECGCGVLWWWGRRAAVQV